MTARHKNMIVARMANSLKDKVEQRLADLKITAFEAAARMGKSRTYVYDIVKGKKTSVQGANLDALADALETTSSWLLHGEEGDAPQIKPAPNASSAPITVPNLQSMPRDVPVFGTASGSVAGAAQGAWQITSDPVDYVRRAPGLATARDAYALYVENESMEPRFPPGELVFIHPGRPVRSGDIVVLQVQNAEHAPIETYIKIMVRRANGDVICRQYNPDAEIRFSGKTVLRVHRVLTMAEVLGA